MGGHSPTHYHQSENPEIADPQFYYSTDTWLASVKADVEDMKKLASQKLSSKYAGAVEF